MGLCPFFRCRRRENRMKMSNELKLFSILAVIALALTGFALYPRLTAKSHLIILPPEPVPLAREALIPPWSRFQGYQKAIFTLVEFGDYQCPSCRGAEATVVKLIAKSPGRLRRVFHHSVMVNDHPYAKTLAMAVEAAGRQGKFWDMHRKVYEKQDEFMNTSMEQRRKTLLKAAHDLSLDIAKFNRDLDSPEVGEAVARLDEVAKTAKVRHTPCFFFIKPEGNPIYIRSAIQLEWYLNKPDSWN